jgi:hypothetical protein
MASFGLCVSSVSVERPWVRISVQIAIAKTATTEMNATVALRSMEDRNDPSVDAEGRLTSAVVHIHGGLAATCNLKTHARYARGVRKVDEGRIVKA